MRRPHLWMTGPCIPLRGRIFLRKLLRPSRSHSRRRLSRIPSREAAIAPRRFVQRSLGPVNTYFAPALLHKKCASKVRSARCNRLWPSFATQHPAFFARNQRNRTDFDQPFVAHRLQRPALPRGSCLALDEIRRCRELRNKR